MKAIRALKAMFGLLDDWLLWIMSTAVSWCVGLAVALALVEILRSTLSEPVSLMIGGTVAGAWIGLVQWRVMQPDVRAPGVWMLATGAGWTLALLVTALVVNAVDAVAGGILAAALGGCVFGLAQWPVLRPGIRARGEWLLMTVVGWTGVVALGIALGDSQPKQLTVKTIEIAAAGAIGLAIWGAMAMVARPVLFPKPAERDRTKPVRWL